MSTFQAIPLFIKPIQRMIISLPKDHVCNVDLPPISTEKVRLTRTVDFTVYHLNDGVSASSCIHVEDDKSEFTVLHQHGTSGGQNWDHNQFKGQVLVCRHDPDSFPVPTTVINAPNSIPVDEQLSTKSVSSSESLHPFAGDPSNMQKTLFGCLDTLISKSNFAAATALLSCPGVDTHWKSEEGNTPLMIVSMHSQLSPLLHHFLSRGSDILTTNILGETPLHVACRSGSLKAVEVLLIAGANPRATTHKGESVFVYALISKDLEVVKMLLQHDREVASLPDANGASGLLLSFQYSVPVVSQFLHELALHHSLTDSKGFGPIHYASRAGNYHSIESILRTNSKEANSTGYFGILPLDLAVEHYFPMFSNIHMNLASGQSTNADKVLGLLLRNGAKSHLPFTKHVIDTIYSQVD